MTVGLGSGSSQGYRDLSLTEARERRLFETQGDDCGERTVGRTRSGTRSGSRARAM